MAPLNDLIGRQNFASLSLELDGRGAKSRVSTKAPRIELKYTERRLMRNKRERKSEEPG
jgi:hypothetical protein